MNKTTWPQHCMLFLRKMCNEISQLYYWLKRLNRWKANREVNVNEQKTNKN
jgi:hypothetical protein